MQISDAKILDRRSAVSVDGKVLAYVGNNARSEEFAPYADGIVLHGRAGFAAARRCSDGLFHIIDPELYLPDRGRASQGCLLPESPVESVRAQIDANADCLLAPSRFPADRGDRQIEMLLESGAAFIEAAQVEAPSLPAYVPVVIRFDELADRRWVEPIRHSGLPIATVFAGYMDPLAEPHQLKGAIELVQAASTAFVMRCDLSVAGLMAAGASAGAIGTTSPVRHLWLPRRGKRPEPASGSLFVPALNNWMRLSFIERAEADPDLDDLFSCDCTVCGQSGDVRELLHDDPESQDEHSIQVAVNAARDVLAAPDPVSRWRQVCEQSVAQYSRLDRLRIAGASKPGAAMSWLTVLG